MNPPAHAALWSRIEGFQFDRPGAALTFAGRLARENGWDLAWARRAIDEYRRFLFLAVTAGHPVTPSDAVDQVWHLHLTYTRSYWDELCREVLRCDLHHDPTRGGGEEIAKFEDWYERTRRSYEAAFGEAPGVDFWPPSRVRFGTDLRYERVNRARHWVVPKPSWSGGLSGLGRWSMAVGLLGAGTGCTWLYREAPFSLSGGEFLVFFPCLTGLVFLVAGGLRRWLRGPGPGVGEVVPDGLDPHLVAMLSGGHARAVQSAVVALAARGSAEVREGAGTLVAGKPPDRNAHPLEKAVYACLDPLVGQPLRPLALATQGQGNIQAAKLQDQGWSPAASQKRRIIGIPLGVALLVPLMGVVRIVQGRTGGYPIGFITAMTVVSLILALFFFCWPVRRTRRGDAALRELRRRHRSLKRPRPGAESALGVLPLAVGLFGSAALADTELANLRRSMRPADQAASGCGTSTGCGSDGGGSGGGDGGGGGGCGGCGGGGGD